MVFVRFAHVLQEARGERNAYLNSELTLVNNSVIAERRSNGETRAWWPEPFGEFLDFRSLSTHVYYRPRHAVVGYIHVDARFHTTAVMWSINTGSSKVKLCLLLLSARSHRRTMARSYMY